MKLPGIPALLFICGAALVGYGYHLLAVPPAAGHEEVMTRAHKGMLSVLSGGVFLMFWLAKR